MQDLDAREQYVLCYRAFEKANAPIRTHAVQNAVPAAVRSQNARMQTETAAFSEHDAGIEYRTFFQTKKKGLNAI